MARYPFHLIYYCVDVFERCTDENTVILNFENDVYVTCDPHLLAVAVNAVSLALMDAGIPMISVVTATACSIFVDGNMNLDPTSAEEEKAVSWVTLTRSSTSNGVLSCITNGLLSEEQFFACSEACQRASESVAAFFRIVQQKKYLPESVER